MNWNLLIVDDEPLNREIIGEFLDDPDYRLSYAENGEEAWSELLAARAEDRAIDLIVLDRMMPVLDGLSLLKRVKADGRFNGLPVIMQTAAAAPEEVREGIEAGAYYYLTKPYEPAALYAIIRAALDDEIEHRRAGMLASRHDDVLPLLAHGEFGFRTLDEAHSLAGALAALCPDGATAALGLTELLVNAIEHGNLGISYSEKRALRQGDRWEEEVARRLALPEFAGRRARVRLQRTPDELVFTVEDQGAGFDWQRYLDFDPERAFDPNGRGIAMARQVSFSRMEYLGCGNVVVAAISLVAQAVADS
jgi:DNA-binding response OmpR family regulator